MSRGVVGGLIAQHHHSAAFDGIDDGFARQVGLVVQQCVHRVRAYGEAHCQQLRLIIGLREREVCHPLSGKE